MYDTTPKTRRRYCPISITTVVLAACLMVGADIDNSPELYRIGLTVFLLAATTLIAVRTGVNTEIVEHARQAGWDEGYKAGRKVARPVIVRKVS
jgi:hypothetical protein